MKPPRSFSLRLKTSKTPSHDVQPERIPLKKRIVRFFRSLPPDAPLGSTETPPQAEHNACTVFGEDIQQSPVDEGSFVFETPPKLQLPNNNDKLPYDILRDIFQLFNDECMRHSSSPTEPRKHQGALLVSHVCRYWRFVALDTPTLWSMLSINPHVSYDLASHFLKHARDAPLSLSYNNPDPRCLDLVISRTRHWRSIDLFFSSEQAADMFLQKVNRDIASELGELSSANVYDLYEIPEEEGQKLLSAFLFAPNLRKLRWDLSGDLASSLAMPAWEHITELTLGRPPSTADCLQVLHHCPQLEYLEIDFKNAQQQRDHIPSTVHPPLPPFITLPALQKLVLRVDKLRSSILRRLTTPALHSLTINLFSFEFLPNQDLNMIIDLLRTSQCPLRELCIDDMSGWKLEWEGVVGLVAFCWIRLVKAFKLTSYDAVGARPRDRTISSILDLLPSMEQKLRFLECSPLNFGGVEWKAEITRDTYTGRMYLRDAGEMHLPIDSA